MSRPYVAICIAAVALVSSAAAVASRSAGADDARLQSLDIDIQARFRKADKRFGISRIMTPDHHRAIRRYTPENVAEAQTVSALESQRLQVLLYLAGRRVLTMPAELVWLVPHTPGAPASVEKAIPLRRVLEGPVTVTPSLSSSMYPRPLPEPPPAEDLVEEGVRAFGLFGDGGTTHTFTRDGWSFLARPIRAGTRSCLRCHRYRDGPGSVAMAVGDVLGVVFYAYRPMPQH